MKTYILLILLIMFLISFSLGQSIIISDGAEMNIGTGTDICATEWGNITGNITGSGSQCGGVLPVIISSFNAVVLNSRDIRIVWITSIEYNNKGFELERKQVNGNWQFEAWIDGNGNTNYPVTYIYLDKKLPIGNYNYRIKQIDYNGNFEYYNLYNEIAVGDPVEIRISQNYPNPSNPNSNIEYQLSVKANVKIVVYDIAGNEVKVLVNGIKDPGYYEVRFDGSNVASGVYFYRFFVNDGNIIKYSETKRMLLVK